MVTVTALSGRFRHSWEAEAGVGFLEVCSSPSRVCQNPLFQLPPAVLKTHLLGYPVGEYSPVPKSTRFGTTETAE
jgi:hypothetical protein